MIRIGILDNTMESDEMIPAFGQINDLTISGIYFTDEITHHSSFQNGISIFTDFSHFMHLNEAFICQHVSFKNYPLLVDLLKNSKHLLIGNPLLLEPEQLDQLFKLADEANVIIKVMQPVRYHAALEATSVYLKNPAYLEIRNETRDNQGSILEALYNSIQPAVFISQANLKKLHAVSIPLDTWLPGMINARIEFDNGCVANITSSKLSDSDRFYCRIHQNNQHIHIDFMENKINMLEIDKNDQYIPTSSIPSKDNRPLQDELISFASNIRNHSFHLNHSENGYLTYLISRKILEKIGFEKITA